MRIDDYLSRLGMARPTAPAAEALRELHVRHRLTFLFENLDIQAGLGIALDLPSLETKFLDRGRGGYCFEHNSLFAALLRDLGFQVEVHLGRVRRGPRVSWMRTHMVLGVTIDGTRWLSDVGFGAIGLLEPIRLLEGEESTQGGLIYSLRREESSWILFRRAPEGDVDLYEFTEEVQTPGDIVIANHYTSTHPDSIFRKTVTVQRARWDERIILRNGIITTIRNGEQNDEAVPTGEIRALVRERFGILMPQEPMLFERSRESV